MNAEQAWLSEGASGWPQLAADGVDCESIRERFPQVLSRNPEHPAELWLALACVLGVPSAMQLFERHYLDAVPAALRSWGLSSDELNEVRQRVRIRLFVAEREKIPVILHCAGTGRLRGLLRVTAVRETIRLRKKTAPSELTPALLGEIEFDIRGLDRQRHELAKQAFVCAAAGLEPRDRTLLRLHYTRGVSGARLAKMYNVHRATAVRWLDGARTRLMRLFQHELGVLDPALGGEPLGQFDNWFISNVELSLSAILQSVA